MPLAELLNCCATITLVGPIDSETGRRLRGDAERPWPARRVRQAAACQPGGVVCCAGTGRGGCCFTRTSPQG